MNGFKVYTLGVAGFVTPLVAQALGLPVGRQQASVLVVAATKTAALALVRESGCGAGVTAGNPEFRVTGWPLAQQIRDWSTMPAVYAMSMLPGVGALVVTVDAEGFRPVGTVRRADGERYSLAFVPDGP